MKVRASVKKLCRNCKIVKRDGVIRVICLQSWVELARLASQSFVCLCVSI